MPGLVFDPPERFVAGTVGPPGQRTFYLQARGGGRIASVALEKQQVAALAERMDEMLDEVVRRSGGAAAVPAVAPAELNDLDPLDSPVEEDFRVATLTLAWDADAERVVVEAGGPDLAADADGDAEVDIGAAADGTGAASPQQVTVRMSGAMARAFVQRALAVVRAGRPPCPFCTLPLDPAGHVCPRQNGYRRR
jgi:uncharacterized repeat protein (TIGR03847 family)